MTLSCPDSPLRLGPFSIEPSEQNLTLKDPATLRLATGGRFTTVNELLATGGQLNQELIELLFLHLFEEQVQLANGPPVYAPQLALDSLWDNDTRTLTVTLAPDASWSDGQPVTADDVVWTYAAQTSPEIGWPYAEQKRAISAVRAAGPKTVVFEFNRWLLDPLSVANLGVVLPKHRWSSLPFSQWREAGSWFSNNLTTSGPWLLEEWKRDQVATFTRRYPVERSKHPWAEVDSPPPPQKKKRPSEGPLFKQLRVWFVPDASRRLSALLANEVDLLDSLTPQQAERLGQRQDPMTVPGPWLQYTFISWNLERRWFQQREVRRALGLAIDRSRLIQSARFGWARPAIGPLPQNSWAAHPSLRPLPYDPIHAKRLLTEAGWVDRDGNGVREKQGKEFRFTLSTNFENQARRKATVLIQEDLARVGVKVDIQTMDFHRLLQANLDHQFDATLGAWSVGTAFDLSYAFHSRSIANGYNYGSFQNSAADRAIDAANEAQSRQAQKLHLLTVQEILADQAPYTFLWESTDLRAINSRVQGFTSGSPRFLHRVHDWTFNTQKASNR